MPAHFRETIPVLVVERIEPSRAFFCDRLGFAEVTNSATDATVDFALVRRNAVTIMLRTQATALAEGGESADSGPYQATVYVIVDQVEMLIPEIADADVVTPLRKTARGMHEIGVREPGGNIIVFASPLSG